MTAVCPLCRAERSALDFHHWNYKTDRGVRICRECHDWVHESRRVRDQDPLAKAKGWAGWRQQAAKNLFLRDLGYNPGDVSEEHTPESYGRFLAERYNAERGVVTAVVASLTDLHALEAWQRLMEDEISGVGDD